MTTDCHVCILLHTTINNLHQLQIAERDILYSFYASQLFKPMPSKQLLTKDLRVRRTLNLVYFYNKFHTGSVTLHKTKIKKNPLATIQKKIVCKAQL